MLSGTSKISFRTVAAFFKRSASFSSLPFAEEIDDHETKIRASAAATNFVNRFLFIRTASFEIDNDQEPKRRRYGLRRPDASITTPPISARTPRMGGMGMVVCSSLVA